MKIGAKQRKFFIIGVGVIAVIALSYTLVTQHLDTEGTSEDITSKKETLLKYLETINLENTYEADLNQYKARLQENKERLLVGDSFKSAQTELAKVLSDFAEKNGLEITQTNYPKEENIEDVLYKVSARIRTQCNSDALVQFLTDIKNYNKFLTIDELSISQMRGSRTRPTSEMRPTFIVSGYISAPKTQAKEGAPSAG